MDYLQHLYADPPEKVNGKARLLISPIDVLPAGWQEKWLTMTNNIVTILYRILLEVEIAYLSLFSRAIFKTH